MMVHECASERQYTQEYFVIRKKYKFYFVSYSCNVYGKKWDLFIFTRKQLYVITQLNKRKCLKHFITILYTSRTLNIIVAVVRI